MSSVIVVGVLRLREDRVEQAHRVIAEVVRRTHEEEGCLTYAAHTDAADPLTVVVVERWESAEALAEHNSRPYLTEALAGAAEVLGAAPDIKVLKPLRWGDPAKAEMR
ncbi:putative quinol monooxygenase [Actinoplanes sp. NPDC023936]|uniref:putative quinol monooxygenase n=1 Tax=Actinoplanes sp. NPDC023936 TaxID=3154910 RepID=UPI0033CCF5A0